MNDYYEVRLDLNPCCEDASDLLAGMLADEGYESFVPDEEGLTAYIRKELFSGDRLKAVLNDFPFDCTVTASSKVIEGRDWNSEWEKNYFQPIEIGGKVVVHSSFHTDIPGAQYDIVIDPKMAFGTGHHSTTSQILTALLSADLEGKSVIDMGTGTGILAILADMRGAARIDAVEIDEYAYEKIWSELSHKDKEVLHAIVCSKSGRVKDIRNQLNLESNELSPYRRRLIRKGIISGEEYGYMHLLLPYFDQYILANY